MCSRNGIRPSAVVLFCLFAYPDMHCRHAPCAAHNRGSKAQVIGLAGQVRLQSALESWFLRNEQVFTAKIDRLLHFYSANQCLLTSLQG